MRDRFDKDIRGTRSGQAAGSCPPVRAPGRWALAADRGGAEERDGHHHAHHGQRIARVGRLGGGIRPLDEATVPSAGHFDGALLARRLRAGDSGRIRRGRRRSRLSGMNDEEDELI